MVYIIYHGTFDYLSISNIMVKYGQWNLSLADHLLSARRFAKNSTGQAMWRTRVERKEKTISIMKW